MKTLISNLLMITILFSSGSWSESVAQDFDPAIIALEANKAKAENVEIFKSYSWKRRTEFSKNNEAQITIIDQVRFNHQGEHEITNLSSQSHVEKKKGPGSKKHNKGIEAERKLMENALVSSWSYIELSKGEMVDFFDKASITKGEGEMSETVVVHGKNVRTHHDELTCYLDGSSMLNRAIKFNSEVDGVAYDGEVNFNKMEDGPNYPARTVINIPDKNLKIVSETFDFIKQK